MHRPDPRRQASRLVEMIAHRTRQSLSLSATGSVVRPAGGLWSAPKSFGLPACRRMTPPAPQPEASMGSQFGIA